MDRRQVTNTVGSSAFGGGVAMALAAINPALTSYHFVLACLSCTLLATGGTVWVVLWATADKKSADERKYVSLIEAGRSVYDHGGPDLKAAMSSSVPEIFNNLDDAGSAYALEAAKSLKIQFFGRRSDGVRMEPLSADDADPSAFDKLFGSSVGPTDVSILRSKLKAVKQYYTRRR